MSDCAKIFGESFKKKTENVASSKNEIELFLIHLIMYEYTLLTFCLISTQFVLALGVGPEYILPFAVDDLQNVDIAWIPVSPIGKTTRKFS
jgi:hypothetical protein